MNTMAQIYTAKTEDRARKLHDDICEALAGSGHFRADHLIVTPVEPFYNKENEIISYGFWVYFDTVELDNDVDVAVVIDHHAKIRH